MYMHFDLNEHQQLVLDGVIKKATQEALQGVTGDETEEEIREKIDLVVKACFSGMITDTMKIEELSKTEHFRKKVFQITYSK